MNKQYQVITSYMKYRNTNKLWAAVKQIKNSKQDMHVSKEELREFLSQKFDDPNPEIHANATTKVQRHFAASNVDKNFVFPEPLVK